MSVRRLLNGRAHPVHPAPVRHEPGEVGDNRVLDLHLGAVPECRRHQHARAVALGVGPAVVRVLVHVEVALAVHRRDHLDSHQRHEVELAEQHAWLVAVTDRVDPSRRARLVVQEPPDRGVDLGVHRYHVLPRRQGVEDRARAVVHGAGRLDDQVELVELRDHLAGARDGGAALGQRPRQRSGIVADGDRSGLDAGELEGLEGLVLRAIDDKRR